MKRLLTLLLVLVVPAACGFLPQRSSDVRQAVWVNRWDYKTESDIRTIVRNCAQANFDTIFFQVRGQGTALFVSNIEPWSGEFGFRYPGFDPLDVACDEASKRGIAVHAWVNILPAWKGKKPPSINNQLYHTKPHWFLYDQNGKRQPLSDHYVILNPCLPEVRKYLSRICKEIVERYPVQGLHMDYIRFVGVLEAGPDYPRDARTVSLYKKDTGLEPQEDLLRWSQWKTEQVDRLVSDIRSTLKKVAPRALLTAAVYRAKAAPGVFQDWPKWLARGKVDAVFPMLYTEDSVKFREYLANVVEASKSKDRIFPGIGVYKQSDPRQTLAQIASVESMGFPGYALYAYNSFFRSKAPADKLEAKDPDLRVRRREAIVTRPRKN
jgi:uncharacterized lipoprotein YddW (UPF0748 family)